MLRIKEDKWVEFSVNCPEYGFKLNDEENAYIIQYLKEEKFPKDYLELQVWLDSRKITIETSSVHFSGLANEGEELEIVYNLIMNGFVEKCK
ncbi:hypothetical protein M2444_004593 [Paenibacillus sp. PastF-3]|uniref:hypothetical protein n=1 Tax=Paenibacillus sp. PastF-3 TaxID=2940626 RepID=UPI002473E24D|nr:hypothetical protein [Paenibacillus sp. PastF-3]MDH6372764.1 hypothetical protein [Paenibacillus sp. PastF-3]